MRRVFTVILLFLVIVLNVESVVACPASFIEYGLRVQFDDCEDIDGYLVDILFKKEDTDEKLYSDTLNDRYFYYEETIRDLAFTDITQIEYLDYDQEWISFLAYFEYGSSGTFYSECIILFGEDDTLREYIDEFKVVILDEFGNVLATSDIYSSTITPDHKDDHLGHMVIYNQNDKTFSLVEYEAEYEINDCSAIGRIFIVMYIFIGIIFIFAIGIVFADVIILSRNTGKHEDVVHKKVLLAISSITTLLLVILVTNNDNSLIAYILITAVQLFKLGYVGMRKKEFFGLSLTVSILILMLMHYFFNGFLADIF